MKLSSLNEEKFIVLIKETNNIDEINNFVKLIWKVSMRWKNWRVEELRVDESSRRRLIEDREHYPWTHSQDSGTTEWSKLYEWFERFSRCWISTQWTIPRYQSTSVFPTCPRSWRIAKPFSGNAKPPVLGDTYGKIGKRFLQIQRRLLSTLSARDQSLEF